MKEQEHHRVAFERYAAMGAGRSLVRLAREMEVSESAVKAWSRAFGWAGRLSARAREVSKALAQGAVEGQANERLKERQIVRLARFQIAKQLAEGQVKATMSDVERILRLDRELNGDPVEDRSCFSPLVQMLLARVDAGARQKAEESGDEPPPEDTEKDVSGRGPPLPSALS